MNIAVFASGRGTNFSAIAKQVKKGVVKANLSLLVCDNPKAAVIGRAKRQGITVFLIHREDFPSRETFESRIITELEKNNVELIVLAGFMRLLGSSLLERYKNRILNIHPALLPSFKGIEGIRDAFDYGAKVTGVTVHFVDEKTDHGPIILQKAVPIEASDTLVSLEAKIHKVEHRLYPEAVRLFVEGKLKVEGRRVVILT